MNDKLNGSGYTDITAHKAIKNVTRVKRYDSNPTKREKDLMSLIQVIKSLCNLFGFELITRIQLKDTKTGKEYK